MSFTYDPLNNLLGPQGPYFRLLMLQPSRDYSEPVHCYLVTHPLRACGKYEALSYVWGDALDRERIWCNETEFLVTRNLHFALQYLRYRNVPRRLWIDAICINQDDISERSQQVAIMHLIYHGARRVAISPGPLDFAHILHDSLPRFAPYMSTADANSTTAEGPPPFVGIREFIALTELMDSPWWRRVWVVQELIVSRDAIVLLGSATLPWSTVIHGILAAAADLPTTIFFYERLRNHRNMPGALALWIYTALHLLTRFKNFRATDPRDKVYGLLGIVNSYLDPLGIMPDYRWTLEKCYIHTATKIIAQTRNLDI
ncbi:heterokaryon incompatibility protein-domain-containing protein, partial [Bisporella sp. PMI_857]